MGDREGCTRLVIIAAVRLYRESLSRLLSGIPEVEVVGVADDPYGAAGVLQEHKPDVVLVDVPRSGRAAAIRAVLDGAPETRVIAFGVAEVEGEVIDLAEAGASGYVSDQASVGDLLRAVKSVSQDELHCSPTIAAALLRRVGRRTPPADLSRLTAETQPLTCREHEVLQLVAGGLSNKQIARRLHLALPTVKNHVHSILQKLQVGSRTEALARLREISAGTSP